MPGADEVLDPGPTRFGDVTFVKVRHPVTGGVAEVPEHLVDHHAQRGWELYDDAPTPPEVAELAEAASLQLKRAELDDLARQAGVPDPETLGSKQDVLDAIAAIDPANPNPSSPDDTTTSQED